MEPPDLPPAPRPPAQAPHGFRRPDDNQGLAIASLILGLSSTVFSPFVIGFLGGIVGLPLGLAHVLQGKRPAGMAKWGATLSAFGMVASVTLGLTYYRFVKDMMVQLRASDDLNYAPWIGVRAPNLEWIGQDGATRSLSDFKGKRVILNFWATWCGPCKAEMPDFARFQDQFSTSQVQVVGLSDEEPDTVKRWLHDHPISYLIAQPQSPQKPFSDLTAVPTTFFIDRAGIIQDVEVGAIDSDVLKKNGLGADYAGKVKDKPSPIALDLQKAPRTWTAVPLWWTPFGNGSAVCAGDWNDSGDEDILAVDGNDLRVYDPTGKPIAKVTLSDRYTSIEWNHNKGKAGRLLAYRNWGHAVDVLDRRGAKVWSYAAGMGVDGAHWGDLNGDGVDEMVVGLNGSGGLHVLSPDGQELWHASLGNVWNQAIVSATSVSPSRVVATDAGGSVHVYDGKGNELNALRPNGGYYAPMNAVLPAPDDPVQILADASGTIVAFDLTGKVAWSAPAPVDRRAWRKSSFVAGDMDGEGIKDWIYAPAPGQLAVITTQGKQLCQLLTGGSLQGFAAISRDQRLAQGGKAELAARENGLTSNSADEQPGLLAILTKNNLQVYTFK